MEKFRLRTENKALEGILYDLAFDRLLNQTKKSARGCFCAERRVHEKTTSVLTMQQKIINTGLHTMLSFI